MRSAQRQTEEQSEPQSRLAQLQFKVTSLGRVIKQYLLNNSDMIGNFLALMCLMGSIQVMYNLQQRILKLMKLVMNQIVCRKFFFWLLRTLFQLMVRVKTYLLRFVAMVSRTKLG